MDHRFQAISPDPRSPGRQARLYYFRAHRRALTHQRRASAAYQRAWLGGLPAFDEWQAFITAKRREQFCYTKLAGMMGWR